MSNIYFQLGMEYQAGLSSSVEEFDNDLLEEVEISTNELENSLTLAGE